MNSIIDLPESTFGIELVLDLYECNPEIIRSKAALESYARDLCRIIEMKPFGDIFAERFGLNDIKTAGYSIVQLIETSSITGHFREDINAAYINIFSCKSFDLEVAESFTKEYFKAKSVTRKTNIRK